jgi:hypothetical protein
MAGRRETFGPETRCGDPTPAPPPAPVTPHRSRPPITHHRTLSLALASQRQWKASAFAAEFPGRCPAGDAR